MKIQKVVFPGIVSFSKETGFNRTAEVNEALRVFRSFCDGYKRREIKKAENSEEFSTCVDSVCNVSNLIDGLLQLLEIDTPTCGS